MISKAVCYLNNSRSADKRIGDYTIVARAWRLYARDGRELGWLSVEAWAHADGTGRFHYRQQLPFALGGLVRVITHESCRTWGQVISLLELALRVPFRLSD